MRKFVALSLLTGNVFLHLPYSLTAFTFLTVNQSKEVSTVPSRTNENDQIYFGERSATKPLLNLQEERKSLLLLAKQNQESNVNKDVWQSFFNKLLEFKKANGHFNVTDEDPYNQDLRSWITEQRKQYQMLKSGKKSKITRKRAAALEQVGLVNPL